MNSNEGRDVVIIISYNSELEAKQPRTLPSMAFSCLEVNRPFDLLRQLPAGEVGVSSHAIVQHWKEVSLTRRYLSSKKIKDLWNAIVKNSVAKLDLSSHIKSETAYKLHDTLLIGYLR